MSNQSFKEYLTEQQEEQNLVENMVAEGVDIENIQNVEWVETSVEGLKTLNEEINRIEALFETDPEEAQRQLDLLCQ
jgi:hypothetical protein